VLSALLVVNEPCKLLAVLSHHDLLPGLPWRPPAALHLDGDGVLLLADWAIMNSANLSSFELISLWASCKIETCSVNCMIIDTCKTMVCESCIVVFLVGGVVAASF